MAENPNRYTRAARAAMLAEKHPQVEGFEEAGGVVEDLPGGVITEDATVAASPSGGETPSEAKGSWERKERQHDKGHRDALKEVYDPLHRYGVSDFVRWDGGGPLDVWRKFLDLERKGQIQLSPEFRQNAMRAIRKVEEARADMREAGETGDVLENKRALQHKANKSNT